MYIYTHIKRWAVPTMRWHFSCDNQLPSGVQRRHSTGRRSVPRIKKGITPSQSPKQIRQFAKYHQGFHWHKKRQGKRKDKWSSLSSSLSRFILYSPSIPTYFLWFLRPSMPPSSPPSARNAPLWKPSSQHIQNFRGGRVQIPIVIRSILPVAVGSGDSASRFTGVMPLVIFIYLLHPHSMYPYI